VADGQTSAPAAPISKARIAFRATTVVTALVGFVAYGAFRSDRAALDIERAQDTAHLIIKAQAEADQTTRAGSFLGSLAGFDKGDEATRAVMGLVTQGDSSKMEEAAKYAKQCDLELKEAPTGVGRAFFSSPTSCKMMFYSLDMPITMKDAGMTVTDTLLRAFGREGEAGGSGALAPACREWSIIGAKFRMPAANNDGESWDFNDGLPDPRFLIRTGPTEWTEGPESTDAMEYDRNLPAGFFAMPGQRIEVKVVDVDAADDDEVSEDSVVLPERLDTPTLKIGIAEVGIVCVK
jgi:hypothetical protein